MPLRNPFFSHATSTGHRADDVSRKMTCPPARTPSSASSRSTISSNSSASTASSSSSCSGDWNQAITLREIHKTGRLSLLVDRKFCFWAQDKFCEQPYFCMLCVHDETYPFLELYEDQKASLSHKPLKVIPLINCQHISPNLNSAQQFNSFTVTLATEIHQFRAGSNSDMHDWITVFRSRLQELQSTEEDKHAYTRCPLVPKSPVLLSAENDAADSVSSVSPQKSPVLACQLGRLDKPAHPLRIIEPALSSPPAFPAPPVPSDESSICDFDDLDRSSMPPPIPPRGIKSMRPVPHPLLLSQIPPPPPPRLSPESRREGDDVPIELLSLNRPPRPVNRTKKRPSAGKTSCDSQAQNAEDALIRWDSTDRVDTDVLRPESRGADTGEAPLICLADDTDEAGKDVPIDGQAGGQGQTYGTLFRRKTNQMESGSLRGRRERPPAMLVMEHKRETRSQTASPALSERSVASTASEPSPNCAKDRSFQSFSVVANRGSAVDSNHPKTVTLRQQQVLRLKQEMNDPKGIRVRLRRKDCITSLALVDCFGCVWVAGWKQREHPHLHSVFHLGDQIISVNGICVAKAVDVARLIKDAPVNRSVVFALNRVPRGRVLLIERLHDGEDLGFLREGKTAEIRTVLTDGLAASQGLSVKAITCDGNTLCNWVITEINHRPLNWYFKDNEIEERLRAVGKEISILVQPTDLVNAIKKQLKSLRNYKDFIVQ